MLTRLDKAPFPYAGGKSQAAPAIWAAIGDVDHYVEPFCGSLATLLLRPHPANRPYYSETVGDADGLLCNVWRSIQLKPQETAEYASWPVCQADIMAREFWLLRWKAETNIEYLMADPDWCDPKAAGYWLYGICAYIGFGWCSGNGPWVVGPDGRITRRSADEPGVMRQRPHVTNNGQGVHRPQLREPGVARKIPYVANNGRGVHHAGLREPGVWRQRPHVGDNGRGVHHAGLREPGVARKIPYVGDNGRGVHHAGLREPDVMDTDAFHPITMPELRRWFAFLSARLRHVRIINADWTTCVTRGVLEMLNVRMGKGVAGIFLDPPYGTEATRDDQLYVNDSLTIAADVRQWCIENGDNPRYRVVLAGFDTEHTELERAHGWRCVEWFKSGFLRGGMGNQSERGHQQHRERLWLSPHCLQETTHRQAGLFAEGEEGSTTQA